MAARSSVIVVGGGHNGLVAANYLAMAGVRVLVLERREFVGGACATEELFPGFHISSCSYFCHMLQRKVIDDLGLRQHGFKVHHLDPSRFQPLPGGQYILTWHDDERTAEEVRRISPTDGARFHDWLAFWKRASGILHRYFLTEPPTLSEVAARLQGTPDEPVFERMLTGNMKDLVEEYFETNMVRAVFIDAQDAGDVTAPGSIMAMAYIKTNQFTAAEDLGIPHGGMGGITQAMARAAVSRGVEIRTGVEVERITVEGGRARAVCLSSGETIDADAVLSNADPKRTFLKLVDGEALPPDFLGRIKRLKTDVAYLKFHCALKELPDFSAYLGKGHDPRYLAQVRICPSVGYFQQSWEDARNGLPSSSPVMHIQVPTVLDNSLAPDGQHILSAWVLYAPVRPRDGTWDDLNRQVGEGLIDVICQYAPNFRGSIIDWELFTPLDLERRVYLTDGNIRHLDITSQQMLASRPDLSMSGYRTPIEGLYLCGAGTHPGGEVTGAPGHNAAKALLRDWELSG